MIKDPKNFLTNVLIRRKEIEGEEREQSSRMVMVPVLAGGSGRHTISDTVLYAGKRRAPAFGLLSVGFSAPLNPLAYYSCFVAPMGEQGEKPVRAVDTGQTNGISPLLHPSSVWCRVREV